VTASISSSGFAIKGRLRDLSAADRGLLCERSFSNDPAVRDVTARIIARVRESGDAALIELARELDGVNLDMLEVPRVRWLEALARTPVAIVRAMERSAANLRKVQEAWLPHAEETSTEPGVIVGRRPDALQRVGVYAPGGRALYPSSVLMGAVPARVAGVSEVFLCSPPTPARVPADVTLAAAAIAGVDRVFSVGGAGAIAAFAYGTQTIPRVDRIVGPGNAYVAEAKMQLGSVTGMDTPAGPSELLVIADASASASGVARELVAQAEHDPDACVVLVSLDEQLARSVAEDVALATLAEPRRTIIEQSLASRGAILIADSLDEAMAFAREFAPEHLLLDLADASEAFGRVRNAGTVLIGQYSSVAFGDYITGANHVLPTAGSARYASGLSVNDFIRWTTYQRLDRSAAERLGAEVAAFAEAESLPAHAWAARRWVS
jgi:histidinol dehydrogenase